MNATIVAGTNLVPDSQTDVGILNIALPFTYTLYGLSYNNVNVGINGNLQFTSDNSSELDNVCLPTNTLVDAILPYWDILNAGLTGQGIYTSTTGSSPNRIFNIEWRAHTYDTNETVNFEVRLYEGQNKFDFIYAAVAYSGDSATVGVQDDNGSQSTQYSCNTSSLQNGLKLSFTQAQAPLLIAHVTWEGRPAQPNTLQQLPITLTLKSSSTELNYPSQTTDATGFFTVSLNTLPSGTYTYRVKGPDGVLKTSLSDPPGFLALSGTVSLTGAAQTNVDMGQMRAGDANNDNLVNSQDTTILHNTYSKSCGNPGYDNRADFNGNCIVNISDFNLMRGNFGTGGAPAIRADAKHNR